MDDTLAQSWPSIADGGPTMNQQLPYVPCQHETLGERFFRKRVSVVVD